MNRQPPVECLLLLLGMALWAPGAAANDSGDVPIDIQTPLLSIETDYPLRPSEVTAIKTGLGAPILSGADAADRLGLVSPPNADLARRIRSAFEEGETLFFSGSLEASNYFFETVISELTRQPTGLSFFPGLRNLLFKAYIYSAQIVEKTDGQEAARRYLSFASMLGDMSPNPKEFPPWVIESFADILASRPTPKGRIVMTATKGCRLFVNGRDMGEGPTFNAIPEGPAILKATCGREESLTVRRHIDAEHSVAFVPLFLENTTLRTTDELMVLSRLSDNDDQPPNVDIAAIGRVLGSSRVAVLIADKATVTGWILDVSSGHTTIIFKARRGNLADLTQAVTVALSSTQALESPRPKLADIPWWQDAAGWTVSGLGLALVGGAAGLRVAARPDSLQIPISYALFAGGSGLLGTGIILLVLPVVSVNNDLVTRAPSVGITIGGRF